MASVGEAVNTPSCAVTVCLPKKKINNTKKKKQDNANFDVLDDENGKTDFLP